MRPGREVELGRRVAPEVGEPEASTDLHAAAAPTAGQLDPDGHQQVQELGVLGDAEERRLEASTVSR